MKILDSRPFLWYNLPQPDHRPDLQFDRSKPTTLDGDDDLCPDSEKETWLHSWGGIGGDDVTIKVRLSGMVSHLDIVPAIKELDVDWRAHRSAFTLHCKRIPVASYPSGRLTLGNPSTLSIHQSSIPDLSSETRSALSTHLRSFGHPYWLCCKTSPFLVPSSCSPETQHHCTHNLSRFTAIRD